MNVGLPPLKIESDRKEHEITDNSEITYCTSKTVRYWYIDFAVPSVSGGYADACVTLRRRQRPTALTLSGRSGRERVVVVAGGGEQNSLNLRETARKSAGELL